MFLVSDDAKSSSFVSRGGLGCEVTRTDLSLLEYNCFELLLMSLLEIDVPSVRSRRTMPSSKIRIWQVQWKKEGPEDFREP